ncbi:MAG: triose-phosphate isomerase [Phyllobacteriaceae bacterium]|nr:triose-phosphate isomerase [Phyllobacteriaceae bacterium]
MTRDFWIGTGWKMNKTIAETLDYLARLATVDLPNDVRVFVVPPFTALAAAKRAAAATPVLVGAQNMHWEEAGARTGEISARMLTEIGVDLVEIGHSERRADCGETDATVAAKVRAAIAAGLRPLVCVGDDRAELEAGASAEAVVRQAKLAFAGLTPAELDGGLLAYEPIWAIGENGRPATTDHVAEVHSALRRMLDARGLDGVALLYGGSVDADNAGPLAALDDVDGLFVGRAAWTPEGLAAVVHVARSWRFGDAGAHL